MLQTDDLGIRKSLCAEHCRYGTRDLAPIEDRYLPDSEIAPDDSSRAHWQTRQDLSHIKEESRRILRRWTLSDQASNLRITRESQTVYWHRNFLLPRIPAAPIPRRIPALLLDADHQSVLWIHTAGLARLLRRYSPHEWTPRW